MASCHRSPASRPAWTAWPPLLVGEENIREVIAFPKTQSGADPLTDAPSPIADAHLRELGLRVLPPA